LVYPRATGNHRSFARSILYIHIDTMTQEEIKAIRRLRFDVGMDPEIISEEIGIELEEVLEVINHKPTESEIHSSPEQSELKTKTETVAGVCSVEEAATEKHREGGANELPLDVIRELFDVEDVREATNTVSKLLYSDNDSVRLKAAQLIIDEHMGRRNAGEGGMGSGNVYNISVLNQRLERTQQAVEAGRNKQVELSVDDIRLLADEKIH